MQRRHIRYARWFEWLCQLTYELRRNTKGWAWKRPTKERIEYVVLKKNLENMDISNKSAQPYRGAHFCLERLTDFNKLEIVFATIALLVVELIHTHILLLYLFCPIIERVRCV